MDVVFAEMKDRLAAIHEIIEKAVADLPDEAMDWLPGPHLNSLGVLLAHTVASERYWIGDVAGEDPSGRVRDEEFMTEGVALAEFLDRSRRTLAHSQSVLSRLTLPELSHSRVVKRALQGATPDVTVAWAILHGLEHAALHAGHIQITRQLWDMREQRPD